MRFTSWLRSLKSLVGLCQPTRGERRKRPEERRQQLALETLEDRLTPSTVNWTGGAGDGNWDTAANWSSSPNLPGPNDAVVINMPGVIVTHSENIPDSVYSLTSQDPIVLSGGSLTLKTASTFNASLSLSGGSLLSGADIHVEGVFTCGNGTLTGSGTMYLDGGTAADPDTMNGTLALDHSLVNKGYTYMGASYTYLGSGVTLTNATGATLVNLLALPQAGASQESFINDGTYLTQEGGTFVGVPFTNDPTGLVRVETSGLSFTGPVINSGTIIGDVGTTLTLGGSITLTPSSSTSADTLVFGSGSALTYQIGGPTSPTGFDQITVSSSATLAGSLGVVMLNGYMPAPGTVLTLLEPTGNATVQGTFTNGTTVSAPGVEANGSTYTTLFGLQYANDVELVAQGSLTVTPNQSAVSTSGIQPATNTGTYTPASGVTLSASLGAIVNNGDGTWSWSWTPNNGTPQTQTVTITATYEGNVATTTFSVSVTAQIADASFETPNVGTGSYYSFAYDPTGSPWDFNGTAGISGNGSGFTSGNPTAPDGELVAFLQQTGSFSQTIDLEAGSYSLTFLEAQRENDNDGGQTFEVLVDGNEEGTFTPPSANYTTAQTRIFTVRPGQHTITFQGLTPLTEDNTAFVDLVALQTEPPLPPSTIADSGFEMPNVGSSTHPAFQYDPDTSPWTFSGTAGISGNGSGFTYGNPNAPEGVQVAFLQQTGSFSQTLEFNAGSYSLTFLAAQRGNGNQSAQTFEVQVDGTSVGDFTPSGTFYAAFQSANFTVTAGSHTISFVGLNPQGGDNTAFIDNVQLAAPIAAQTGSFDSPSVGSGNYLYNPTGSDWTFGGNAGVAANGSAFTSGNPNAPAGMQVAFLQQTGTMTTSVNLQTAGTFNLSCSAAQRGNGNQSSQTFEVLVNGTVVGTFAPSSTAYAVYQTSSFTAPAGPLTITFVGLNPNGGDNTAFVDAVVVNGPT